MSASQDDLAAVEGTLDLLSDPTAVEEIRRAQDDLRRGRIVDAKQLRAKYLVYKPR